MVDDLYLNYIKLSLNCHLMHFSVFGGYLSDKPILIDFLELHKFDFIAELLVGFSIEFDETFTLDRDELNHSVPIHLTHLVEVVGISRTQELDVFVVSPNDVPEQFDHIDVLDFHELDVIEVLKPFL